MKVSDEIVERAWRVYVCAATAPKETVRNILEAVAEDLAREWLVQHAGEWTAADRKAAIDDVYKSCVDEGTAKDTWIEEIVTTALDAVSYRLQPAQPDEDEHFGRSLLRELKQGGFAFTADSFKKPVQPAGDVLDRISPRPAEPVDPVRALIARMRRAETGEPGCEAAYWAHELEAALAARGER